MAALALPGSAAAADISVTSFGDSDVNPPGCTLREAISSANADDAGGNECTAGSGSDRILLAPGTYALGVGNQAGDEDANAEGDLDITSPVEIVGAGVGSTTIDATGTSDRILELPSSAAVVTIRDLKLTGGHAPVGAHGTNGADPRGRRRVEHRHERRSTARPEGPSPARATSRSSRWTSSTTGPGSAAMGASRARPAWRSATATARAREAATAGAAATAARWTSGRARSFRPPTCCCENNVAAEGGDGGKSANAAAGGNGGAAAGGNGGDSVGGNGGDGGRGGAIWAVDSEVTLTRVQLISNDASRGGFGGGFGTGPTAGAAGSGGNSTGNAGGAGGSSVGGNGGQGGEGAGIAQTRSTLEIVDSRLSKNLSGTGGFAGDGGAGGNGGTGSSVTAPGGDSTGGFGGSAGGNAAISAIDVGVDINRSTIDENDASQGGNGGGAAAAGSGTPNGLARGRGGGVGGFVGGVLASGGSLNLTNSTLSKNAAGGGGSGGNPGGVGGNGGGSTAIRLNGGATANLLHLTIAEQRRRAPAASQGRAGPRVATDSPGPSAPAATSSR